MSNDGLKKKVVTSGFWVFSLRLSSRILNLLRLIVLARILAPHDFGLMGIALLVLSTIDTFSQPGFQAALIQRKGDISEYLNSAWTFLILRNFILFGVVFLIAPYAAGFFNIPEAELIIKVLAVSMLIDAFNNIGIIFFQKELEFNKQFVFEFTGQIANFAVAVSAAIILQSVWALVYGSIARSLVSCIVSYMIHPYRPRLNFDLAKAKELFEFGRWILGSSILVFLLTQGDDIFVGKLLGATALGFYQMAYRIQRLPITEITNVISRVTFPAYSKLQDDLDGLREGYFKVLQLTAFLSVPIAGLIFVFAYDFTSIVLGIKWMPMAPILQILAVYGAIMSLSATTGPLFQGIGEPHISTKLQFLRLIILIPLLYFFIPLIGIIGAALSVLVSVLIIDPLNIYIAIKKVRGSVLQFSKIIFLPFLNIFLIIIILTLIKQFINVDIIVFVILVCLSFLIYWMMSEIFYRTFNYETNKLIKKLISQIQKE